ncbi:beta-galactosidase b protein [Rutstroemia sp. NJR-2017a WRK4]|nr:beta-galactosidase b protein [Rutstroemia sp. NJR-2017a WRK4]
MFLRSVLTSALALSGCIAQNTTTWPKHNNGLTTQVEWDHYSLIVNGERLFIWAGELHYWRIPVPELWVDILQKIKAAGFNTFALYSHWYYHNPNPDTLDFESGAHNFTRLFDLAAELGMYVIFRPGPYVNAESNAGAFPLWLTTGAYGALRNNDTRYTEAWKPFWETLSSIVVPYQITNGGNVLTYQIENELGSQWSGSPSKKIPNLSSVQYMEALEASARAQGITIPFQANDPNLNSDSWSKDFYDGYGAVDIYGMDSYPACWTCNLTECDSTNGAYKAYNVIDYYDHFQAISPTQPSFLPEFQGGSFNPWGGPEGGCPQNTPADFANLFYRNNVGQRVTAMSLYMLYGGTNWGWLAAPVVATSYDYSSPISENRMINDKYAETKLFGHFLRVAKDLTVTDRIGTNQTASTNPAVVYSQLRNPNTNAGFYVSIHQDSTSGTREVFKIHAQTSRGNLTIPQYAAPIVLNGFQSKIIVTDFNFGSHSLIYSTAEVLSHSIVDGQDILALWMPTGEAGEFVVKGAKSGNVTTCQGCSSVGFYPQGEGLLVTISQSQGMSVITLDDGLVVLVMDRSYAYKFWVPVLTANPFSPANESIFVQGPSLVRSAAYSTDGATLDLTGDNNGTTTKIEVFPSKSVTAVTWNSQTLSVEKTRYGSLIADVSGPTLDSIILPSITGWKSNDSLPERLPTYDDSWWVTADHMNTSNPTKPETLPVLYIDDYGYHVGNHLWRGRFEGSATGVYLSVIGGRAFGYSVWLNGNFIGSYLGAAYPDTGSLEFSFGNATVNTNSTNTLLILQDNSGHDETSGALTPRGISNATLISSVPKNFTSWKVTGTAGKPDTAIDSVRGILSEGGLYAERVGWHLPGFDSSSWTNSTPSSLPSSAGVTFYRTVVPLSISSGLDVAISFTLNATPSNAKLRALLFVNGYQYGRFNPWIGNQVEFPVPPGILNYDGDNVIGLSVWRQDDGGEEMGVEVGWKVTGAFASSFEPVFDAGHLQPGWTEERLEWA